MKKLLNVGLIIKDDIHKSKVCLTIPHPADETTDEDDEFNANGETK